MVLSISWQPKQIQRVVRGVTAADTSFPVECEKAPFSKMNFLNELLYEATEKHPLPLATVQC